MSRLCEVVVVLIILWLLLSGCEEYRPSVIDIRDEPTPMDWSPRQPEKFADTVLKFRGYDSSFKFQNQLNTAQGRMP
jgi:hypothetical protein